MILPFLLFWVPFLFLLSSLPSSLPDGFSGVWGSAAWALEPLGPAFQPLPLLMGKAAFFIFPFGSPAYRMNLAGALLVSLTPLLAFRMMLRTRPHSLPGPALLAMEDDRRWATLSLLGIALWAVSPPFVRSGTNGIAPAVHLFFPLFFFERYFSWRRKARSPGERWMRGWAVAAAGGLLLTLDIRWALLGPALLWGLADTRPRTFLFPFFMGATLIVSFFVPWVILSAYQAATLNQLVHILPSTLKSGLLSISPIAAGDHGAFLGVGGLFLTVVAVRVLQKGAVRFPRAVPLGMALFLLAELGWMFSKPPSVPSTESRTHDLFRSLPRGSTLICSSEETRGAALYAQRVLGKRRDLLLREENDPLSILSPETSLFREQTAQRGEFDLPVGFALHPLDVPVANLSSPLAHVSLGRIPLFLAETRAPSSFLALAHRQLGDTFASLQIPDQAEEEFLAALALHPKDRTTGEALGRLLMDYGDPKRAKAALQRTNR